MGQTFTIADAYLFVILNWTGYHKVDLKPWPALHRVPGADRGAPGRAGDAEGRRPGQVAEAARSHVEQWLRAIPEGVARSHCFQPMSVLPTLFLSHGSPMHAVEPGDAGDAWRALAASIPRPRAVLIASAHWETALPMLTGRDGSRRSTISAAFPRSSTASATTLRARPRSRAARSRCCATPATRRRSTAVAASTTAPGCRCGNVSGPRRAGGAALGAARARHGASPSRSARRWRRLRTKACS